jgi:cholesterol oxidase
MQTEQIGITFDEVMSGGFALGQTDTATGAAIGAKDILVMHGTVTIDDIDAFIADPNHFGRLDVVMDWPSFGTGLPAPGGIFNLFSPTGDPALKLMVYEWGVKHEGQDYYFAGQKNVQVHPVLEVWHDTTTLHTQLHQGKDKTGPVVGAGIISLSFEELLKMGGRFKPIHSPSTEVGLAAVSKFGKFFMGELWDTYVKRVGA